MLYLASVGRESQDFGQQPTRGHRAAWYTARSQSPQGSIPPGQEGRQVQRHAVPVKMAPPSSNECGATGKQTEDKEAFPIGEHLPPQSK